MLIPWISINKVPHTDTIHCTSSTTLNPPPHQKLLFTQGKSLSPEGINPPFPHGPLDKGPVLRWGGTPQAHRTKRGYRGFGPALWVYVRTVPTGRGTVGTSSFSMVFHILLDCRGGDVVLRVLGKCEVYDRYPRRNNVNTVCGRDKWNNDLH